MVEGLLPTPEIHDSNHNHKQFLFIINSVNESKESRNGQIKTILYDKAEVGKRWIQFYL